MPIRIGNINLKRKFLGSQEVHKVLNGAVLLYKSITQYVTDFSARIFADGGNTENVNGSIATIQDLRNKDLFSKASFLLVPSGTKTSKLYTQLPENGTGDMTVTRNSTATKINSLGNIESVGVNFPRIDYSSGQPALLVEPQRTNLVFPSAIGNTQTRTVTGATHTVSFYGTGTVVLSGVGTGTLVGTGATNRVSRTFNTTSGSLTLTVTGSVTEFQLEVGSHTTSHIPTTTTTATRSSDILTLNNVYSNGLISNQGGAWFIELNNNLAYTRDAFGAMGLMSTSDVSSGTGIRIRTLFTPINRVIVEKLVSNGATTLYTTLTDTVKIVSVWNGTNMNVFVNGLKVVTNTSFVFVNMNFLTANASDSQKNITQMALFPTPLTDTEAIQLTTL